MDDFTSADLAFLNELRKYTPMLLTTSTGVLDMTYRHPVNLEKFQNFGYFVHILNPHTREKMMTVCAAFYVTTRSGNQYRLKFRAFKRESDRPTFIMSMDVPDTRLMPAGTTIDMRRSRLDWSLWLPRSEDDAARAAPRD